MMAGRVYLGVLSPRWGKYLSRPTGLVQDMIWSTTEKTWSKWQSGPPPISGTDCVHQCTVHQAIFHVLSLIQQYLCKSAVLFWTLHPEGTLYTKYLPQKNQRLFFHLIGLYGFNFSVKESCFSVGIPLYGLVKYILSW